MKLLKTLLALSLVIGAGVSPVVEAGAPGKALSRLAMKRLFRQEAARDAASVAKPLMRPRTVYRYVSRERAAQEIRQGLAQGKHMTSVARPGQPLSPEAAQRRYGLVDKPEVRETIRLPQGFQARHNRVWAGEPGVGEITSPEKVPPGAIRNVVPLQ